MGNYNINQELLKHIKYISVFYEGARVNNWYLQSIDDSTRLNVTFVFEPNEELKLPETLNAYITKEELNIYINLGVTL